MHTMKLQLNRNIILVVILSVCLTACKSPIKLFKHDMQQGNFTSQAMVEKLKVNLSKTQVQAIMGSPAHIPMLQQDTWVYSYYFTPGDGGAKQNKQLILQFKQNKLKSYSGDWQIPKLPKQQ